MTTFGQGIVNTFDQNGTPPPPPSLPPPPPPPPLPPGARFTGLHAIPASSNAGVLLSPPRLAVPCYAAHLCSRQSVHQIAFGLDDKLKTPYSHVMNLSLSRELPGGSCWRWTTSGVSAVVCSNSVTWPCR